MEVRGGKRCVSDPDPSITRKSKPRRVAFKTFSGTSSVDISQSIGPPEHSRPAFLAPPQPPPPALSGGEGPQWRDRSGEGATQSPGRTTLEPICWSRGCGREGVGPEGKGRETPGECGGGGRGDAMRVGRGLRATLGKGNRGRERRGRALRLGRRRTRAAVRASDARERGTSQGQPDWGSWRRQLLKHARQLRFGVLGSSAPAGRWARRENVSSPGCVWRWHR